MTNNQAVAKQTDLEAVDIELNKDIKWLETPIELEQTKPDLDNEHFDRQHSRDGPEPEI